MIIAWVKSGQTKLGRAVYGESSQGSGPRGPCTAAHISPATRKAADWVKVRRCENVVVGVVRGLQWPLQVPSTVTWPGGSVTNDLLICPTDAQWYDDSKLVEFYLKHWDRKGMGFLSGRSQSAQSSALEAFTEQFPDCAKAAKNDGRQEVAYNGYHRKGGERSGALDSASMRSSARNDRWGASEADVLGLGPMVSNFIARAKGERW